MKSFARQRRVVEAIGKAIASRNLEGALLAQFQRFSEAAAKRRTR
jgi:hypothetical protein